MIDRSSDHFSIDSTLLDIGLAADKLMKYNLQKKYVLSSRHSLFENALICHINNLLQCDKDIKWEALDHKLYNALV